MKNETARREIESLDYYLQNHTDDYSEESHTAMMMAKDALNNADVLEKIRIEIDRQEKWLLQAGYTAYNVDIAFDSIKLVLAESEE
jgi:hypothetical protein